MGHPVTDLVLCQQQARPLIEEVVDVDADDFRLFRSLKVATQCSNWLDWDYGSWSLFRVAVVGTEDKAWYAVPSTLDAR